MTNFQFKSKIFFAFGPLIYYARLFMLVFHSSVKKNKNRIHLFKNDYVNICRKKLIFRNVSMAFFSMASKCDSIFCVKKKFTPFHIQLRLNGSVRPNTLNANVT